MARPEDLSPEDAAATMGIPLDFWPGQCFGIASAFVDAGLVAGHAVYGHFLGRVSKQSVPFGSRSGLPFQAHGWVILPDGRIFDPTRWVFEAVAPYLFIGPANNPEYDEGGNKFRTMMRGPAIAEPMAVRTFNIPLAGEAAAFARLAFGHDSPFGINEARWLAHTAPNEAGLAIAGIYEACQAAGLGALIPLDNRRAVLGH